MMEKPYMIVTLPDGKVNRASSIRLLIEVGRLASSLEKLLDLENNAIQCKTIEAEAGSLEIALPETATGHPHAANVANRINAFARDAAKILLPNNVCMKTSVCFAP